MNALRAFDAAARHLSFKKASEELSVTPAAVSQQVRSLEDYLGVQLFRRVNRSLHLTPAAESSLSALQEGFKGFEAAVAALQVVQTDMNLKVSVSLSFASKWLVPRLGNFHDARSDIVVRVSASMMLVDFASDDFDLAIRYGAGSYPGLHVEELLCESVAPICSPALLEGDNPVRGLKDLSRFTLIHDDSSLDDPSCPDWHMWLKAASVSIEDGHSALHFNQSNLAIEAAIAGRGVALAKSTIAAADIKAGRLVRPFDEAQPVDFAYYIVCPEDMMKKEKVRSFVEWLRAEAAEAEER